MKTTINLDKFLLAAGPVVRRLVDKAADDPPAASALEYLVVAAGLWAELVDRLADRFGHDAVDEEIEKLQKRGMFNAVVGGLAMLIRNGAKDCFPEPKPEDIHTRCPGCGTYLIVKEGATRICPACEARLDFPLSYVKPVAWTDAKFHGAADEALGASYRIARGVYECTTKQGEEQLPIEEAERRINIVLEEVCAECSRAVSDDGIRARVIGKGDRPVRIYESVDESSASVDFDPSKIDDRQRAVLWEDEVGRVYAFNSLCRLLAGERAPTGPGGGQA